ncbi:carboxypeptidase-like regulatory domain-containing protein [Mesonia algae]|uniref:carboxypeptidase-like regulatory domain-containing protein n=1 Tax=Mesonia algae TaxID=213248 RepID=UPI0014744F66|nr:carboxypeptidase-like regulatory domain-containing protein [Mesonia algae]
MSFTSIAQNFTSTVKSKKTKQPLSYVNVSILNKRVGTSTNLDGEFSINLEKYKKDTLLISCLGFSTKRLDISSVLKNPTAYREIYLEDELSSLDDVVINVKKKKYGSKHSLGLRKKWFYSRVGVQFGMEQAILIPNDKSKVGKIEEVSFWVGKEEQLFYNSRLTWFRIKFYSYDKEKNEPKELLSYQDIIVKPQENEKQNLKVDVSSYHIYFPKDGVCVVIETVNPKPSKESDNQYITYPQLIYSNESKNRAWKRYRGNNWFQQSEEHRSTSAIIGFEKKYYIAPALKIKVRYEK